MAKYSVRATCGHEGCKEIAFYEADTRADQDKLYAKYGGGKWRCLRHTGMDEVLSPDNLSRSKEMVSHQDTHGRYFGYSGFIAGPGFKLWAKDFPAGTRLRVTAEVILPEPATAEPGPDVTEYERGTPTSRAFLALAQLPLG